jgi:hypothetical protein
MSPIIFEIAAILATNTRRRLSWAQILMDSWRCVEQLFVRLIFPLGILGRGKPIRNRAFP